jgi:hypothetical protein
MEKTVIQFIVENILLFLPVGITGIVVTVILYFMSKQEDIPELEDLKSDFITLFNIRFNIYVLVYLFIWIMIIIIGLASNFIIPTIIGGIIAVIPLILMTLIELLTKNSKVL